MPNFGKIRPAIVERSKSCAVMGVHNRSYNNRGGARARGVGVAKGGPGEGREGWDGSVVEGVVTSDRGHILVPRA